MKTYTKPLKTIISCLLVGIYLSSCLASPSEYLSPEATGSVLPTISQPIVPTFTQVVVETSTYQSITPLPTFTPSPTFTTTPTPVPAEPVPVCTGLGELKPTGDDFGLPGVILYQKRWADGMYTLGGNPLVESHLPGGDTGKFIVYGFSPDGEWLAYSPWQEYASPDYGFETPTINLLSRTGVLIETPIDVSLFDDTEGDNGYFRLLSSPSYWLNDQLLFAHLYSNPYPGGGSKSTSIPKIINPFTGEWGGEWFYSLPNRYQIRASRSGSEDIAVSPDLTRVLYPSYQNRTNPLGVVLYDLVNQKLIWQDTTFNHDFGSISQWSPDGSMVVIGNPGAGVESDRKVMLISSDGSSVTEIINSGFTINPYPIYDLAWSPDSRTISIAIYNTPNKEIYLYDVQQQKFLYRCPLTLPSYPVYDMIWSPDSQWIAINADESPFILMNVQTGDMNQLLDFHSSVVGWSDTFPVEWP